MFTIGLIDDDGSQLRSIRRSIKENWPEQQFSHLEFKNYEINLDSQNLLTKLFEEILKDILGSKISGLIIDYKILSKNKKIEGTELFSKIRNIVPKFPVVILTERVEESLQPLYIDADKVYEKSKFLRLKEEYCSEKVKNLFLNMKKYIANKEILINKLENYNTKYLNDKLTEQELVEMLELEKQLSELLPSDSPNVDEDLVEDLKEIVSLLKETNTLE